METQTNHLQYLKGLKNEELVSLFFRNNLKAFNVLIDRHFDKLKNHLHNKLHNQYDEDELMQAVMITAFHLLRKRKYREENRFEHWLMGIARNCLKGYFREKNARKALMDDGIALEELSSGTEEEEKEDITGLTVDNLLAVLPVPVRKIVALHGMMGVKHKEIGEQMGIKPENVRQMYHRAIEKIKDVTLHGSRESNKSRPMQ